MPDGSVHVLAPAPEMFDEKSKTRALLASKGITFESESEVLEFILNKGVPKDASDVTEILATDLPSRDFRNAWKIDGGKIDHDMEKAKEILKAKLRVDRAPLLSALDVEYQKADESGDSLKKRALAAEKQKLRDVTSDPRIAAATTIEDLTKIKIS